MEQLVVIFVFAVCAAVCISIFVESYLIGKGSLELNNAIRIAGNGAESYISAGGDTTNTARFLGAVNSVYQGDLVVYYDEHWLPCLQEEAHYVLRITNTGNPAPSLITADVTVSRINGEVLYEIAIAVREDGR
jgi:predicted small secreted protein